MVTYQKYDGTVPLPGETKLNSMTAEQQIRAKAAKYAVGLASRRNDMKPDVDILGLARTIETYIREGK